MPERSARKSKRRIQASSSFTAHNQHRSQSLSCITVTLKVISCTWKKGNTEEVLLQHIPLSSCSPRPPKLHVASRILKTPLAKALPRRGLSMHQFPALGMYLLVVCSNIPVQIARVGTVSHFLNLNYSTFKSLLRSMRQFWDRALNTGNAGVIHKRWWPPSTSNRLCAMLRADPGHTDKFKQHYFLLILYQEQWKLKEVQNKTKEWNLSSPIVKSSYVGEAELANSPIPFVESLWLEETFETKSNQQPSTAKYYPHLPSSADRHIFALSVLSVPQNYWMCQKQHNNTHL